MNVKKTSCSNCNGKVGKTNVSGLCWECYNNSTEIRAARSEHMKKVHASGMAVSKIKDIPLDMLDEYRNLTRSKRFSAAEARKLLGIGDA